MTAALAAAAVAVVVTVLRYVLKPWFILRALAAQGVPVCARSEMLLRAF